MGGGILPPGVWHAKRCRDFRCRLGQEGLEEHRAVAHHLAREVHDGGGAGRVGFLEFPRLLLGQVLVAEPRHVHGFELRFLVAVARNEVADFGRGGRECLEEGAVGRVEGVVGWGGRHRAVIVLAGEHQHAVHEVAQDVGQLVVDLVPKVAPSEFAVFLFRHDGREDVTHGVAAFGEVLEIVCHPDRPVPRRADFVALEVHELVGRHVGWEVVAPVFLEQDGEDDAVENDVVLANEMEEVRRRVLPPVAPVLAILLAPFHGGGDVPNGGIQPNVQDLAICPFHGHRHPPIEVTGHGAAFQSTVDPRAALSQHVGLPFLGVVMRLAVQRALDDVVAEPIFVPSHGEVPQRRGPEHRCGAAEGGARVDELGGTQGLAAFLALVAVRTVMTTRGTGALDVAVGQKLLGLFVEKLFVGFDLKGPFVKQRQEKVLGHLVVLGRGGAAVVVEADVQPLEGLLHLRMVGVHDVPRGRAFFFCTKRDRRTVFIAPTNPKHVFSRTAQVPNIDVGRQVRTCDVPQVDGPVGVGKRRGDHPPGRGVLWHGDKGSWMGHLSRPKPRPKDTVRCATFQGLATEAL